MYNVVITFLNFATQGTLLIEYLSYEVSGEAFDIGHVPLILRPLTKCRGSLPSTPPCPRVSSNGSVHQNIASVSHTIIFARGKRLCRLVTTRRQWRVIHHHTELKASTA
jgi:hypothetical protein